jgi:hypothetical protein
MHQSRRPPRRRAVQLEATTATCPLVHIRTAGAAGKLSISLRVPGGTETMRQQVSNCAAKYNVEVSDDYTSQDLIGYAQQFVKSLPPDAVSYDDASNNQALVSGKSVLSYNLPSARAVAKRDAPEVAEDCWTFPCHAGPVACSIRYNYVFPGIWEFAKNKSAAKDLVRQLIEREQIEVRAIRKRGIQSATAAQYARFQGLGGVASPKGTVYNYPIRPWHNSKPSFVGYPAPPEIAVQMDNRAIIPTVLAKLGSGQIKRSRRRPTGPPMRSRA